MCKQQRQQAVLEFLNKSLTRFLALLLMWPSGLSGPSFFFSTINSGQTIEGVMTAVALVVVVVAVAWCNAANC